MKNQSYNEFWQRIHHKAKNNGFPLRVMFELTYRCNFYCPYCYVPLSYRRKKELKTKEVFSILDQLKDLGCLYLGFTGGEPFVRNDIMQILWYAKKKGFEIIIYTNGSLINKKISSELAFLRLNKIDITIPAMSRDAFEHVSKVSGSHNKVFRTIELLHGKGVNLGFKTCVLKDNVSEIYEVQNFVASLAAMHRLDDRLSPCLDGSNKPFIYRGKLFNANKRPSTSSGSLSLDSTRDDSRMVSKIEPEGSRVKSRDESNANLRECVTYEKIRVHSRFLPIGQRGISENSRLFKCGVGQTQAAITPQGELKMCVMIDYPKYKILNKEVTSNQEPVTREKRLGLKKAWRKLKRLVASIKPDENYQCYRCKLKPYCKWCPARGWLYNMNFSSCDPESRRSAEKIMKLCSNLAM